MLFFSGSSASASCQTTNTYAGTPRLSQRPERWPCPRLRIQPTSFRMTVLCLPISSGLGRATHTSPRLSARPPARTARVRAHPPTPAHPPAPARLQDPLTPAKGASMHACVPALPTDRQGHVCGRNARRHANARALGPSRHGTARAHALHPRRPPKNPGTCAHVCAACHGCIRSAGAWRLPTVCTA